MGTEEEFSHWLRRSDKSLQQNLQFAVNAWQSADFAFSRKYELILLWLAEELLLKHDKDLKLLLLEQLKQLLELNAHPGLVAKQIKVDFVHSLLKFVIGTTNELSASELLFQLSQFEVLQDLFRSDYVLFAQVLEALLRQYNKHLQNLDCNTLAERESKHFSVVLEAFKESVKKAGDAALLEEAYKQHILQPLAEVLLQLKSKSADFFQELVNLERSLCEHYEDASLVQRIFALPLPALLLTLECAVVHRRSALQLLLETVFCPNLSMEHVQQQLTIGAYTLDFLRKHEVSVNFELQQKTANSVLGAQMLSYVLTYQQTHLSALLLLLCAALRYNPLLLEQQVFQLAALLMMTHKNVQEQQLFEQFLLLLINMFRRLSRAEKFVVNLLKSLKEWLKNNSLLEKPKKRKSQAAQDTVVALKKQRLDSDSALCLVSAEDYHLDLLLQQLQSNNNEIVNSVEQLPAHFYGFANLQYHWPSSTAGLAFSKLIAGLVAKPSFTIWKTLLYSLKEMLQQLQTQAQLTHNDYFELEFHAALLCQYFAGCRLVESADKFVQEIAAQQQMSAQVLNLFGNLVIQQQRAYDERLMNAFLECSYYYGSLELLLSYYQLDGCSTATQQQAQVQSFLPAADWTLLKQQIKKHGTTSSKNLLNRLKLQKTQANMLLQPQCVQPTLQLTQLLVSKSEQQQQEQLEVLMHTPHATWLQQCVAAENFQPLLLKALAVETSTDLLPTFSNNMACLERLTLLLLQQLSNDLAATATASLLAKCGKHFEQLLAAAAESELDKCSQELIEVLNAQKEQQYQIQKLPSSKVQQALHLLQKLPVMYLRRQRKTQLLALLLALLCDLNAANATELRQQLFIILKGFLQLGYQLPIFKYFPADTIMSLVPMSNCWPFYEFLFSTLKWGEKGTAKFLDAITALLKQAQTQGKLSLVQMRLILLAIDKLAALTGVATKEARIHLNELLHIYGIHINQCLGQLSAEAAETKQFVQDSMSAFPAYMKYQLTKMSASLDIDIVDAEFVRLCKLYVGYSMDYRNEHALRLIDLAATHRNALQLSQEEIEFVLTNLWQQLNADLLSQQNLNEKTAETAVSIIIDNRTNEDLLLTMKNIAATVANNVDADCIKTLRLLKLMTSCHFSTFKGAIFSEEFKNITADIMFQLSRDNVQRFVNNEQVLAMLSCQSGIVENRTIPLSTYAIDGILAFLVEVNIKEFVVTEATEQNFFALHLALSKLCAALVKHRHFLVMDRVPTFMHIFKQLVQAIVWYKSERTVGSSLTTSELDSLAELAMKVESLMHLIGVHSLHVKRVAPFVLTFVINLMVSKRQCTTLYPKIKTYIESICYDLIAVCDHRVDRFILRCSNEAARQYYEMLVKDHKRFRKFKGKV